LYVGTRLGTWSPELPAEPWEQEKPFSLRPELPTRATLPEGVVVVRTLLVTPYGSATTFDTKNPRASGSTFAQVRAGLIPEPEPTQEPQQELAGVPKTRAGGGLSEPWPRPNNGRRGYSARHDPW